MLKHILGLLAIGLLAVSPGACGGGSAKADASPGADTSTGIDGRIVPDGSPAIDSAHPGDFISADVDGVTLRAEFEPKAGTMGLGAGQIWLGAGLTSNLDGWLLYIDNSPGTTACSPNWIALFDTGPTLRSDNPGGSCSVTVTATATALGEIIQGTFTATLGRSVTPPSTAAVTNGVFRVTRTFQ